MNSWAVVAVFLEFVVFVISLMDFSNLRGTKVLYENCTRTDALSVLVYNNRNYCALKCSQNVRCRRMMTCSHADGVECSLFYEGENCASIRPTDCSCFRKTYSKVNNTAVCPIGLYGDDCEHTIIDCTDGHRRGMGVFKSLVRSYIKPLNSTTTVEVLCELGLGGYTYFMTRDRTCQDVSFNRNITEYINGFGDPSGDHWLGLNTIKKISDNRDYIANWLSVILIEDNYDESLHNSFFIGAAADGYPIYIRSYSKWNCERCGDSLTGALNINRSPFSAPGSDKTSFDCSNRRQGGWWYANDSRCSESYFMGSRDDMVWPTLGSTPQNFVGLRIRRH